MSPPTLVYDDDCGFCTRAARFVERRSDVDIVGFSELTPSQRERLPADYERCAHFLTDEAVYSCGEAMDRAYERTDHPPARFVPAARRLPGYALARDAAYRLVANNRPLVGRLLR